MFGGLYAELWPKHNALLMEMWPTEDNDLLDVEIALALDVDKEEIQGLVPNSDHHEQVGTLEGDLQSLLGISAAQVRVVSVDSTQ